MASTSDVCRLRSESHSLFNTFIFIEKRKEPSCRLNEVFAAVFALPKRAVAARAAVWLVSAHEAAEEASATAATVALIRSMLLLVAAAVRTAASAITLVLVRSVLSTRLVAVGRASASQE